MPSQKPSGAQFKKRRAEQAKLAAKQQGALEKFFKQRKQSSSSSDNGDHSETETETKTIQASTGREDGRDIEASFSVDDNHTESRLNIATTSSERPSTAEESFSPLLYTKIKMPSQKPSGAQFKKRRAEQAKLAAKQQGALEKFFKQRKQSSSSSDNGDHSETETETKTIQASTGREDGRDIEASFSVDDNHTESRLNIATTSSENTSPCEIDFNNPSTWDLKSDKFRCLLVEHGPCQRPVDFVPSQSEVDGRTFSLNWFEKKLNGEKVPRLWLMYCSAKKALFCFPCILYPGESDGQGSGLRGGGGTCPAICDPNKGFSDWGHLSRAITQHENSPAHKEKYLKWKRFETNLKRGRVVDKGMQDAIASEKQRWRHALKITLRAVLFCAQNNLALRGASKHEAIGQPHAGIFLNVIELISNFDTELQKRIKGHKKGDVNYLSPAVQNEFINLLANKVRTKIMENVKNAKYYSIMFDSTPDVSHKEQVCQVLRYVHVTEGKVSVEESFIDLIESHEKTGAGLAEEFLQKLEKDGLDIQDIRGQCYDNAANMAGKYSGVQAHLLQRNNFAVFVPCAAHSLNLVGVHAASSCQDAKSFFGTVQGLYTFFSSSIQLWTVLMSFVKVSLKQHADTRWCSKAAAVSALCHQLKKVIQALESLLENKNEDIVSTAKSFLLLIDYKFVCLLVFWDTVLNHVDKINKSLQSKQTSISQAAVLLSGLKCTMKEIRNSDLNVILNKARDIAANAEIDPEFPMMRGGKRMQMADENVHNEIPEDPSQEFRMLMYSMLDKFITELTRRFGSISELVKDFGFLFQIQELDVIELHKCAAGLGLKYHKDLDAFKMDCEVQSLKRLLTDTDTGVDIKTPEELLQFLYSFALVESYPNIVNALRIFLSLPVTVASCERSFSKLKLIKNYLRSTMSQDRLSGLAMLSIEQALTKTIDFDDVIDDFASVKSRRVLL